MNNLYVQQLDFVNGVTLSEGHIDSKIDASDLNEWLENFADEIWGYNAIGGINLPDDRNEIIVVNDDNVIVASIKYTDFLKVFPGAKITRKYALLRKSTKDVHYSDDKKYFFFDTYGDAYEELKKNTALYSKKILFFNTSDRYGTEIVFVDDNFNF